MFYRSSFDSSATLSKRKAQTEGEDTEEDVEEQKVNVVSLIMCLRFSDELIHLSNISKKYYN